MFDDNLFDRCLEQIMYEGFILESKEEKLKPAPRTT